MEGESREWEFPADICKDDAILKADRSHLDSKYLEVTDETVVRDLK